MDHHGPSWIIMGEPPNMTCWPKRFAPLAVEFCLQQAGKHLGFAVDAGSRDVGGARRGVSSQASGVNSLNKMEFSWNRGTYTPSHHPFLMSSHSIINHPAMGCTPMEIPIWNHLEKSPKMIKASNDFLSHGSTFGSALSANGSDWKSTGNHRFTIDFPMKHWVFL